MKKIILGFIAITFALVSCDKDKDASPEVCRTYDLLGTATYPEGIAVDERNGDLYTGSLIDGSIQKTTNGVSTYFLNPGTLLAAVLGIKVDENRNRLWICNNTFAGQARISVYDLSTKALIKNFDAPSNGTVFFNDIVIDANGNTYITNSYLNQIYKIDSDLLAMNVYIDAPVFSSYPTISFNGLELTTDGSYIIASSNQGINPNAVPNLYRIKLSDKSVAKINLTGNWYGGADGLITLSSSRMLGVCNFSIFKIDFNSDFSNATVTDAVTNNEIKTKLTEKVPATLALYNNTIYTGLDQATTLTNYNYIPPFQIYGIPLSLLNL